MKRLLILALLLAAIPAPAVMYKWVDADGKVHYSDQSPPQGVKNSGTLSAPASTTPAPVTSPDAATAAPKGPKTAAEQEMEFRKRRLETADAEVKRQREAQAAEDKKRGCTQATNRLAALEAGGRVTKNGANGETVFLSDTEIARELVDTRRLADSWCK